MNATAPQMNQHLDAAASLPMRSPNGFDAAFIERHDRSGPRYTSYPTAAQFTGQFTSDDYLAAVQRSRELQRPISLYVHLPFCTSPCFYCGCTRVISKCGTKEEAYLKRLEREIEMQGALFKGSAPVQQLHFGGGTPNFFSTSQLAHLMHCLQQAFGFCEPARREYSIEVDPRALAISSVQNLAAMGFNRMSLGIQDFDPAVQRAVNREQTFAQTESLLQEARKQGFDSISVDLIYGLPKQTLDGFGRTLEQVIALAPDRISAYSFAHMPSLFRAQNQIKAADLPTPRQKLQLLKLTIEMLQAAGYVYIGMDHFARPGDELTTALEDGSLQRNFQGYSTHGGAVLIGLGMSSISRVADCYSQNAKTLDGYYAAIDTGELPIQRGLTLSTDDQLRRSVIEAIMCRGRIEFSTFERNYHILFPQYFAQALQSLKGLEEDGLLRLEADSLTVTPQGRFLLRTIAMCFDAYLPTAQAPVLASPRYSKVI